MVSNNAAPWMVTGSESVPFAVKTIVWVYDAAPAVCAHVEILRIRPPPEVVISPESVVSPRAGVIAVGVIPQNCAPLETATML